MKIRQTLHWLSVASLVVGLSHQAQANIIVTLDVDPAGTFDVFLEDNLTGSTAGTFGIAAYGIPLQGDILTVDHESPQGSFVRMGVTTFNYGFAEFRSSDEILDLTAGQDIFTPAEIVVGGFGQTAGDLASLVPAVVTDVFLSATSQLYDAKLLIASGTWNPTGAAPSVNTDSVDFLGNVFSNSDLSNTQSAVLDVHVVPAPSAFACGTIACFGFAVIKRRLRRFRKTETVRSRCRI